MNTHRSRWVLVAAVVSAGIAGCQSLGTPGDIPRASDQRVITSDIIERSAAGNVWDLLRQEAHGYDYREDRNGLPVTITTHHGISSISLVDAGSPVLIIDGARINDYRYLREIPIGSVDRIELLSGINGTATQGTNAGAGVIYIHTKSASDP